MLKLVYSMADLDAEMLLEVYKEQNLDENDFLSYLREDFFCQSGAIYAIWADDSLYKSAVRLEPYRDGLLLHSLETVPNGRRRGYAYQLLLNLLDFLRVSNYNAVYSHIDKRNRASFNLHIKCGFEIIADTATYLDGTVTQNSNTLCIRL